MSEGAREEPRSVTFRDGDVADFIEEMVAFLEGHLALLDARRPTSQNEFVRWDQMIILALRFIAEQPAIQELIENGTQRTGEKRKHDEEPEGGDSGEKKRKRV